MEKPLVIIGSARKNGNKQKIVDFVFKGEAYEKFDLLTAQIFPYNYEDQYPASDQFEELVKLMLISMIKPNHFYTWFGFLLQQIFCV